MRIYHQESIKNAAKDAMHITANRVTLYATTDNIIQIEACSPVRRSLIPGTSGRQFTAPLSGGSAAAADWQISQVLGYK